MKEKLNVAVLFLKEEVINRKTETFDQFIQRLRKKYVNALETERVVIQVVERKSEHHD